jgi:hypothetical protein
VKPVVTGDVRRAVKLDVHAASELLDLERRRGPVDANLLAEDACLLGGEAPLRMHISLSSGGHWSGGYSAPPTLIWCGGRLKLQRPFPRLPLQRRQCDVETLWLKAGEEVGRWSACGATRE